MGTRSKQLGSAPRPCRIAAALLAAGALIAAGPALACTDLQFRSLGQQTWVGSRGSGYDVFDASPDRAGRDVPGPQARGGGVRFLRHRVDWQRGWFRA